MGETELLRQMLPIAVRESPAGSARAEATLAWCREHKDFLGLPDLGEAGGAGKKKKKKARKRPKGAKAPWQRLRAAMAAWDGADAEPAAELPRDLATAGRIAELLALAPAEARLLTVAVALNRLRRPASLAGRLRAAGFAQMRLVAELAGLDSPDALPQSAVVRLGLAEINSWRGGDVTLDLTDAI